MQSGKSSSDQVNPWAIAAYVALAVSFIFLVPVSHLRKGEARESKTTWQLLTERETASRSP
jgi:hypothetical protein